MESYDSPAVMAGLGPAIHALAYRNTFAWMPATSAGMTTSIRAEYSRRRPILGARRRSE